MKVIINNISIYHIHDNKYFNNGHNNRLNVDYGKRPDSDLTDFSSHIVVDDGFDNDNPLVAQLKARILQSESEVKELIEKLKNEGQ